ncbi:unnamed protein product [Rotaria socialis]
MASEDDPQLHDYNVPERVQTFIKVEHDQAVGYAANHIVMTMGSDFENENANEWYKNLDKLIRYVNQANRIWTTKTNDFFPMSLATHGILNDYFTSRPALKRYECHSNNILQVTRQLNGFSNNTLRSAIFPLSEAMGIGQHHDAVSGAEKQYVANDYAQRLSQGADAALYVINEAYKKLLSKADQSLPMSTQYLCQFSNISECLPIERQDSFTLTIWNPTIQQIDNLIRVPVTKQYKIRSPTGETIAIDHLRVEFDDQGNLNSITNRDKNITLQFSAQGLYWYTSFQGSNSRPEFQSSGAYYFRPLKSNPLPVSSARNM